MNPKVKKLKDRERFFKYGGMKLVENLLKSLPFLGKGYKYGFIYEKALNISVNVIGKEKKGKHKHFLAETIIRYAVGNGYLGVKNKKYFVTSRAKKYIKQQKPFELT